MVKMGKALVIVESSAKAKTINKYLGNKYVVKSSIGHIRDLPTKRSSSKKRSYLQHETEKQSTRSALVKRMGIDPYNGWRAEYEIVPGKEKVIAELKALAEKAEHIYLATDMDREGEAIAWHLKEVIGGDDKQFSRILFNEITQDAIIKAFEKPGTLNMNRVNAQQARRFMDRIVGYMLSPLLWKKVARGLSAGRVQSVAVKLIVEREREIKFFKPKEYWELKAHLSASDKMNNIPMQVTNYNQKTFKPVTKEHIDEAVSLLEIADYAISNIENKPRMSNPGAPFTTSTLQQAGSTNLGYSIKKTMMLAQALYEAGYITYMRTDSTNISQKALIMAHSYICDIFGNNYLPKQNNVYLNKDNAQEAHEAIRPSDITIIPAQLKAMGNEANKLYQIIWNQFIASQMQPAQYNITILTVTAGNFQLRASNRIICFDGWTRVLPEGRHKGSIDQVLSDVSLNQRLTLNKLQPIKHFTKPPFRYNEASLVKEMEKLSIGRPSTYVSIISTIQDRGYVYLKNRRFYAEKIGEIVTDRLVESFQELMSYDFTANMENTLDKIAANQQEWKGVLNTFFSKFSQQLEQAYKDPEDGGMRPNIMVMTNIDCLVCGCQMGIRTASTGVFLGCHGYSQLPNKRCKNTINLIPKLENINIIESEHAETKALRARYRCYKCNSAMDSYLINQRHQLHICGNNPLCNGYEIEQGDFISITGYDLPIIKCEKCSMDMQVKLGRFGRYMSCTNPGCSNTRRILRNGDIAAPKKDPILIPELICKNSNAYFVLRDGASGIFLAANTFPKSRETRAPLVEELVRFKDRLPEKLRYLTDAPVKDENGYETVVRFKRKTKQHYVSSQINGKDTGWEAFYIDNQWKVHKSLS